MRALGLRVHLGWADAVTLTGVPDEPTFVERRSVALRSREPGAIAFPFHAAMEVEPDERAGVIAQGMATAEASATEALLEVVEELEVGAIGVVVGRGVLRIPVERIIASSQLFHTAEAEIYQRAIRVAGDNLGLPVARIEFGAAETHPAWSTVSAMKAQAGTPWRKDHKFAAIAAWEAALIVR